MPAKVWGNEFSSESQVRLEDGLGGYLGADLGFFSHCVKAVAGLTEFFRSILVAGCRSYLPEFVQVLEQILPGGKIPICWVCPGRIEE